MRHRFITGAMLAIFCSMLQVSTKAQAPLRSFSMNVWGYMTVGAWDVLGPTTGQGVPYYATFQLSYFDDNANSSEPTLFRYYAEGQQPQDKFSLSFGDHHVRHYGEGFSGFVEGWNNSPWREPQADAFVLLADNGYEDTELFRVSASIDMIDSTGTAFTDALFSPDASSIHDIARWNRRQFFANGFAATGYFWFYGTVEGLSIVPEPNLLCMIFVTGTVVLIMRFSQYIRKRYSTMKCYREL